MASSYLTIMQSDHDLKRELIGVAAPLWAAEAEIVREYFDRPRTIESDLRWLRAQAFKETRHLRALPEASQREYWESARIPSHPDGAEEEQKLADEMKHFELIAGLIQCLAGRRPRLDELQAMPQERTLQEMRAPYRRGSKLDRSIVDFTEGGGGAMYEMLTRVSGGEFERRIASAFAIILADEVLHGPAQIHRIAELIGGPADWDHARSLSRRIGGQRVHMRNEMFGFPLEERRIAAIFDGDIEPWPTPIALDP